MRRGLILAIILLVSLVFPLGDASSSSPTQQLAAVPMTYEISDGTVVLVLGASVDTFAPGIGGYVITQYEYFGYHIYLDDASDSAIDVDITIQTSSTGASGSWVEYTQNCIYPATAAGTATLAIADENHHQGSISIAPTRYMRFVLDNNNADIDVTPVIWFNIQ